MKNFNKVNRALVAKKNFTNFKSDLTGMVRKWYGNGSINSRLDSLSLVSRQSDLDQVRAVSVGLSARVWKHVAMIFAVLTLACGNVWADQGLEYSGGFESGTDSWNKSSMGTLASCTTATYVRTGSKSLQCPCTNSNGYSYKNVTVHRQASTNYVHFIVWTKSSASTTAKANSAGTDGTGTSVGTSGWTQLTAKASITGSGTISKNFQVYPGLSSGSFYIDDAIVYYSTSSTTDVTAPTAATSASATTSSISWTNGSDANTGRQNTLIWKRNSGNTHDLSLNNQGVYAANDADQSGNWTCISATVAAGTDNAASSHSGTYTAGAEYAIVHRDLAYNYSTPTYVTVASAAKKMIYLKNTMGWENAYVTRLGTSAYWSSDLGSGSYGRYGTHAMTYDSAKKLFYYEAPADANDTYLCFTADNQSDYANFNGTQAVYVNGGYVYGKVVWVQTNNTFYKNTTKYYGNEDHSGIAHETYSADVFLSGTFNAWAKTNDSKFSESAGTYTKTIELAANTAYQFQIVDNAWFGNNGGVVQSQTNWDFYASSGDCHMISGPAGNYTFTYSRTTNKVSISYPEVDHPNAGYVYYDNSKTNWSTCQAHHFTGGSSMVSWNSCPAATAIDICGTEYFYSAFDKDSYSTIIFHNGSGTQTGDWSLNGNGGKKREKDDANWSAFATYTISFNGNGKTSGTMSSISSITANHSQTITSNTFEKSGYTFAGWKADVAVKINGSTVSAGTVIDDGATLQNICGNIALTAQWTPKPYTITLNGNGGTGNTSSVTATYNSAALSSAITNPSLDCYTFDGWYSGEGGTGALIINTSGVLQASTTYTGADGIWTNDGNVDLYAKWSKTPTSLTVNLGGDAATPAGGSPIGTAYTLTCSASTGTIASYQWKQNTSGTKVGAVNAVGTGTTSANFNPVPAAAGDYWYFCVATDACGNEVETSLSGCFTFNAVSPIISWDLKVNASWVDVDGTTTDETNISSIETSTANTTVTDDNKTDKTSKLALASSSTPDKYVEFTFYVACGKKLTPDSIVMKVLNVGGESGGKMTHKAELSDEYGHSINGTVQPASDGTLTKLKVTNGSSVYFQGAVSLKVWAWNHTGTKGTAFRMGKDVDIYGSVASQSTPSATITWDTHPANGTVGDDDVTIAAHASDGSTVSYISNNVAVATIVAGKVHYVGAGTTTIQASITDQCGNTVNQNSNSFTVSAGSYTGLSVTKDPSAGSASAPTISATSVTQGSGVTVTAGAAASGYVFTGWTSENGTFASASSLETTFTPTANNAVATANYAAVKTITLKFLHNGNTVGWAIQGCVTYPSGQTHSITVDGVWTVMTFSNVYAVSDIDLACSTAEWDYLKSSTKIYDDACYNWNGSSRSCDATAPTLDSSNPDNGDTDVNISGTIVLTFSEEIDNVDDSKFSLAGATIGTVEIDGSDATKVNIAYSGAFYSSTVTLSSAAGAVSDAAGNASAALSDISFTTKAEPTLTALVSGTLYKANGIWSGDIPGSDTYKEGLSDNNKFYFEGSAGSSSTMAWKSYSETTLNSKTFTSILYFKEAASVTSNVPSTRAMKFILPSAGSLTIYYRDNNNGAGRVKLNVSGSEPCWSSSEKGDHYATKTGLSAGTYYLYATAGSTGIFGVQFDEDVCSAPTSAVISGGGAKLQHEAIELVASASGTESGVTTYTWYRGNDGVDAAKEAGAIQATSTSGSTYTIAECSTTDAAVYYCVISNGTGCEVTASTSISVTAAYTLTYSANTDDPSVANMPSPEVHTPGTYTLSSKEPTRTGYTFDGWYYYSDYAGTRYAPGASFTTGALNETLYAKWKISYSLSYDNGTGATGSASGGSAAGSYEEGTTITTPAQGTLANTGYTFRGWTDGTTFYLAGQTFSMPASNVTLTAVWDNGSGGACNTSLFSTDFSDDDWDGITSICSGKNAADETYNGITFHSYSGDNAGKPFAVDNSAGTLTWCNSNMNSNYWIAIPVTGVNGSITTTVDNGSTATRFNYVVKQENSVSSSGGSGTNNSNSASDPATVTISNLDKSNYVVYLGRQGSGLTTLTSITITTPCGDSNFDVSFANMTGFGGSTTLPSTISGVPTGKKIVQPADPTASGYTFGGWYSDAACTAGNEINWSTMTITADKTIYAKWCATHTVAWVVNGADYSTGSPTTSTTNCDGITTMPTAPADNTLSGCANSFRGWSATNLYGEAVTKHPMDLFVTAADAPTINADKTFYAVFGTATDKALVGTVLWSEDWTGATTATSASADAAPSGQGAHSGKVVYGGSVTYTQTTTGTFVRNENTGGGTAPELFVKANEAWTIAGIPSGGADSLILSYKRNNYALTPTVSGDGYSISSKISGSGADTYVYYIKCGSGSTFTLTFTAGSSNVRLDDIVVKVKRDGATNYRCICPSLTVTPVLVTASTPIFITSAASKTVRSQDSLLIVGSGLQKNATLSISSPASKFALKSRTNGNITTDENGAIPADTYGYIYYTPDAGDTSDGLDNNANFTITDGTNSVTVSQALIGRHLPANFVIAAKNGDKWYALPADMSSTATPAPVEIEVDDSSNPTTARTPDANVYSLYPPINSNITSGNGQYIRLGMHGVAQEGSLPAPLFGAATGSYNLGKSGTSVITSELPSGGWWWKLQQTNTTVTDTKYATYNIYGANNANTLKLYNNAEKWGFYASGVNELRLIPWNTPYSITYHLNGASWVNEGVAVYYNGTGATLPVAGDMTNIGYTFDGWYANSNLSTGGVVTSIGTEESGDKEFWAKWTENSYTITYNANNGSATGSTSNTVGHYVTVADCGYALASNVFTGWNTATNGSGASYAAGEEIELTADLLLYAQWASDYDISWDASAKLSGVDVTPNLGGGNYTITASVSSWTGTLTTDMISAVTDGVTITNVTVDNSSSPKTITATFSVGASVAGSSISFELDVPAADDFGAKSSTKDIAIDRCTGSGGGSDGVLFSAEFKDSGLGTSNICAAANTPYTFTTTELKSAPTGASIKAYTTGDLNHLKYVDNGVYLKGADAVIEIDLNNEIRTNDLFEYVNVHSSNPNAYLRHTTAGNTTDQIVLTGYGSRDMKVMLPAAFDGKTKLFIVKNSTDFKLHKAAVVRPAFLMLLRDDTPTSETKLSGTDELTTSTYLSIMKGGHVFYTSPASGDVTITRNSSKNYLSLVKTTGYLRVDLDDPLQEGDVIGYDTYNGSSEIAFTTTTTRSTTIHTTSQLYTVDSSSPLKGQTTFYIWYNSSSTPVRGLQIARSGIAGGGGGTDKITPTLNWETNLSGGVSKKTSDDDFIHTASQDMNSLGAITYSSNNTAVATVNATTGEVHLEGTAGEATITATIAASGCYNTASVSYVVTVEDDCDDVAGTITTEDLGCSGIKMTVTGHTAAAGVSYQWYKVGSPDVTVGTDQDNFTATTAGSYYVIVTNTGDRHCAKRSRNTIEVEAQAAATATKIVDSWYVKNGRRTPDVELVQTTNANGFTVKEGGAVIWNSDSTLTTGFGGCGFHMDENGIIYLNGTKDNGDAPNGLTGDADVTLTITAIGCGGNESKDITIYCQEATTRKSIAFVVDGTENGTFAQANATHSTESALYQFLDYGADETGAFDLTAQNIYSSVNEKDIREHFSQYDAILITDDPSTNKVPNKEDYKTGGYVNAFGTMIDVRPILSMEAYVSKLSNWKAKGVSGDPSSPNPRQYEMRLQCKDHEIYSGLPAPAAGTHVWSETIDGEEYRHVIMVDSTKSPYAGVAYNEQTGGKEKPALQGFASEDMGNLLGLGLILNGTLHAGVERQEEPAARMMLLGIQNKALPSALTEEGKKVIENALTYLLKSNMEEVDDCSNFFKGGASGDERNWNNTANWAKSTLPNYETRVRILAPCVISGTTVKVAQVDIATSGKSSKKDTNGGVCNGSLTIAADGALIVSGKIRTAEAPHFAALDLKPTEAKDLAIMANSSGNGTLIFNNADGDTKAWVQMYSKTQNSGGTTTWQYIGIPHSDISDAQSNYYNSWLYSWDPSAGWLAVPNRGSVSPWTGYCITHPESGHTFNMEGTLVATGTVEIEVPDGAYQVIGNSWTAPIYIPAFDDVDFENINTKTIYFFNTGLDENGSGELNKDGGRWAAGTYVSVPIYSSPYTGDSLISSMQGFYVANTSGSAGTLHLDYDKIVRPRGTRNVLAGPMHAPRRVTISDRPVVAKFWVSGSRYDDRLVVLEREDFTRSNDDGWDGEKWDGSTVAPCIWSENEDGGVEAVTATPDFEGTTIGFRAGEDDTYSFSFEYDGMEDELYLLDIETQLYTRVLTGNTYTFTCADKGEHNRFLLTRNAPGIATGTDKTENASGERAKKFIYENKMYIFIRGVLYDATGKRVTERRAE